MAREVCFLIGPDDAILWADASASPTRLPDSRERWEAIWARRDALVAIAHSHPFGPAAFSREDDTTMDAIDHALGRALTYAVVAPRTTLVRDRGETRFHNPEPWWSAVVRAYSGMPRKVR